MSRLASKKVVRLDLGDGEWIEIKASIGFAEFQDILGNIKSDSGTAEQMSGVLKLAAKAVVGWNLKDDDGAEVPYSEEQLNQLDLPTMTFLQEQIIERYGISKKKEQP